MKSSYIHFVSLSRLQNMQRRVSPRNRVAVLVGCTCSTWTALFTPTKMVTATTSSKTYGNTCTSIWEFHARLLRSTYGKNSFSLPGSSAHSVRLMPSVPLLQPLLSLLPIFCGNYCDRRPLFDKYHQSFRAFKAQGWIDDSKSGHYWSYIRKDVDKFLVADPDLDTFLESLPKHCPKYIFTNAREEQAREALACLGVERHFEGIFGSEHMGDHCKPELEAFEKVLKAIPLTLAEGRDGREGNAAEETRQDGWAGESIVLFEDSFKNLMAAKQLGMKTVLICE